jgi:hypothetical protein
MPSCLTGSCRTRKREKKLNAIYAGGQLSYIQDPRARNILSKALKKSSRQGYFKRMF